MDLKFDPMKNIATIRIVGAAGSKEILAAFDAAVASEQYKPGMGRLWDFREIDLSELPSEIIKQMAHYSRSFPPGINDVKVAFVVSRQLEYGLARMFAGFSEEARTTIRVFQNVEDAESWMVGANDTDAD